MGDGKDNGTARLRKVLGENVAAYMKRFDTARAELDHPPTNKQTHFLSTSMRRLMAADWACNTFCGKSLLPLKAMGFKTARKVLGRLRDAQVMQETLQRLSLPPTDYGSAFLRDLQEEEARHTAAFLEAYDRMDCARVAELRKKKSDAILPAPPSVTLREVRRMLMQGVLALLPEAMVEDEALHAMRVKFKYYRYCNEMLAPLMEGVGRKRLAHLKDLQDAMGAAHDAVVLQARLAAFEPGVDPAGRDAARLEAGRLARVTHARAREVVAPALMTLAEIEGMPEEAERIAALLQGGVGEGSRASHEACGGCGEE